MCLMNKIKKIEEGISSLKSSQNISGDSYSVSEGVLRVSLGPENFFPYYAGKSSSIDISPNDSVTTAGGLLQIIDIEVYNSSGVKLSGWGTPAYVDSLYWQTCTSVERLSFRTENTFPNYWEVNFYTPKSSLNYILDISYKTNISGGVKYTKWSS